MSDMVDMYRDLKKEHKADGHRRRDLAAGMFDEAKQLAFQYGFTLAQHSHDHYTIITPEWRLHVYPGNQRLYRPDRNVPFVDIRGLYGEEDWTLLDVVSAVIHLRSNQS